MILLVNHLLLLVYVIGLYEALGMKRLNGNRSTKGYFYCDSTKKMNITELLYQCNEIFLSHKCATKLVSHLQ